MERKYWGHADLENLDRRFRANLVNSIGGFKCLTLVGTLSGKGNLNLATFNSIFHLGADPALCGMVLRPAEPGENTLGNILHTGQFTLNHVLPSFYEQAHQCSAKYPEGISEFAEVGLTPEWKNGIRAPFVQESCIKIACQFEQKIDIHLNGTVIIVGRMIHLEAPDSCVLEDGTIDLEVAQTVTSSGLDSYHLTKRLGKLPYAKVPVHLIKE